MEWEVDVDDHELEIAEELGFHAWPWDAATVELESNGTWSAHLWSRNGVCDELDLGRYGTKVRATAAAESAVTALGVLDTEKGSLVGPDDFGVITIVRRLVRVTPGTIEVPFARITS